MENKVIKNIDFNIDLATVSDKTKSDELYLMLDYVSSVNIACSFINQNDLSVKNAIEHSKSKGKVIGLSLSLPEAIKKPLDLTYDEIESMVLHQLGALSAFAKVYSANIEFVRPNSAMYKLAAENKDFSLKIAKAIQKFSKWLVYYGAFGKSLDGVASEININVARELILNKNYKNDLTIDFGNKKYLDEAKSIERLSNFVEKSEMYFSKDESVNVNIDTINIPTDSKNCVELLKKANEIIIPRPINYNNVVESGWVE